MSSVAESVGQLAPGFIGQLLRPTDTGYDDARRVHNGLVDRRPALIARCRGVADVVDAVKLARTLNLETDLTDDGVKTMVECFEACPSPTSQMFIEHFHGAVTRVPVSQTACAMRLSGYNIVIASPWSDGLDNERNIAWGRGIYAAMRPYFSGRCGTSTISMATRVRILRRWSTGPITRGCAS